MVRGTCAALNHTDDDDEGWCLYMCTYAASITTATPFGCRASNIAIAICLVRRSWTERNKIWHPLYWNQVTFKLLHEISVYVNFCDYMQRLLILPNFFGCLPWSLRLKISTILQKQEHKQSGKKTDYWSDVLCSSSITITSRKVFIHCVRLSHYVAFSQSKVGPMDKV